MLPREDLAYMFHQAGVSTGVDLGALVEVGTWISETLSTTNESRAANALKSKKQLPSQPSSRDNEKLSKSTGRSRVDIEHADKNSDTLTHELGPLKVLRTACVRHYLLDSYSSHISVL